MCLQSWLPLETLMENSSPYVSPTSRGVQQSLAFLGLAVPLQSLPPSSHHLLPCATVSPFLPLKKKDLCYWNCSPPSPA